MPEVAMRHLRSGYFGTVTGENGCCYGAKGGARWPVAKRGLMDKVTIEINSRWVKIARSPIYFVVAALQGVAVTFAPLFLYWCGKGYYFFGYEWIVTPTCFALIYLISLFYFWLGSEVIRELRQKQG